MPPGLTTAESAGLTERMEPSDPELVERIRGGDTGAFRFVVERYSRMIHRLAWRITGNEADADDVVQETFLRAFRQLHTWESRASLGTWLHRIAANCALDLIDARHRREGHHADIEDMTTIPSSAATPDRLAHGAEMQRAFAAAMNNLTGNERTAFVLRHFEGMPLEQIGEILGTRLNATKNTIFRAVRKLREQLQPYTGSPI